LIRPAWGMLSTATPVDSRPPLPAGRRGDVSNSRPRPRFAGVGVVMETVPKARRTYGPSPVGFFVRRPGRRRAGFNPRCPLGSRGPRPSCCKPGGRPRFFCFAAMVTSVKSRSSSRQKYCNCRQELGPRFAVLLAMLSSLLEFAALVSLGCFTLGCGFAAETLWAAATRRRAK
jgi:hypothetical protein